MAEYPAELQQVNLRPVGDGRPDPGVARQGQLRTPIILFLHLSRLPISAASKYAHNCAGDEHRDVLLGRRDGPLIISTQVGFLARLGAAVLVFGLGTIAVVEKHIVVADHGMAKLVDLIGLQVGIHDGG